MRKEAVIFIIILIAGRYLYGSQWQQTSWNGGASPGSIISVNSNCIVYDSYTNIIPGGINVQPNTATGGVILETVSITNALAFYEHFDDTSNPYRGYSYDGTYWDGTEYYSSQVYSSVNKYGGYSLNVQGSREYVLTYTSMSMTNYINYRAGTIELWVKPSSPFSLHSGITKFIKLQTSNDRRTQLGITNTYLTYGGYINYTEWSGNSYNATNMVTSEWVHLAVVWSIDSNTNAFYINGEKVAVDNPSSEEIIDSIELAIGGEGDYSTESIFNGYIDEVMIYNYAKKSNEILSKGSISRIDSAIIKLVGGAKYNNISWVESEGDRVGGAASMRFKFRTTVDDGTGNPDSGKWTAWLGPDGTTNTYYTNSGQAIATNHYGGMYFQYRAFFSSSAPYFSKKLESVTIDYTLLSAVTSATAEIIPTFIELGTVTSKTMRYYIKPEITGGRTGINLINIIIPSEVQFKSLENVALQGTPYTADPGTYTNLVYPTEYSNYISGTNLYITFKSNMVNSGRRIRIDFIITNLPTTKTTIYFRSYVDDTITVTPADTVYEGNGATTGDLADVNGYGVLFNSYRNPVTLCYGEIYPDFGYIYRASSKKFSYFIKPVFGAGDSGYDYIRLSLPDSFTTPTSIDVKRNGSSTVFTNKSSGRNIIVALASKVTPQNNDIITIEFTTMPTKNGEFDITGYVDDRDYLTYPSASITSGNASDSYDSDKYSIVGAYNYIPGDEDLQENEMYVIYENDVNTRLIIEKGTFSKDILISIERVTTDTSNLTFKIEAKDDSGNMVYTPEKDITLNIHYNDTDNNGYIDNIANGIISVEEADKKLGVYYFDGVRWILIGKQVDSLNRLVSAQISHFSLYSLRADNSITGYTVFNTGRILYTNPITPNGDGVNDFSTFTMKNINNPELKIYDINGNFIIDLTDKIINNGEVSTVIWEGTDDNGEKVATGVYVYFFKSDEFTSKGTILVVR